MSTPMKVSRQGLMELISHEAIVQSRYKDTVGVWTIGVGHTKAAGAPDPRSFGGKMPIKDVFALFATDIARYENDVRKAVTAKVSQTEFDALVSFHFNTGGIRKASLVKALNAGDRKAAADQFLNWSKPAAIIGRRRKEQKLFAEGVYAGGGKATVYPADGDGAVQWKKGKVIDLSAEI